ncbi:hypothetical protein PHET_00872 [Paragonimus heterotremus]|uniref:Uncharacterized protein n=1 Tax=Paragonimus heterotremus TaxID=100268 RepID=A0A8J4WLP0_9TREM|nr:hypothetical protein PHET_00872 [Paragonimus heterotremus]
MLYNFSALLQGVSKNCSQYLMIIILNSYNVAVVRFKNFILRNRFVLTQNTGTFIGITFADFQATQLCQKWSASEVPFLFVFDDSAGISKFLKEIRLFDLYNTMSDICAVPLTNAFRSVENKYNYIYVYLTAFSFLEITLHDIEYPKQFREYVSRLPDLATKHKGVFVAGTKSLKIDSGKRVPNYIVASQWTHKEYFEDFLKDSKCLALVIVKLSYVSQLLVSRSLHVIFLGRSHTDGKLWYLYDHIANNISQNDFCMRKKLYTVAENILIQKYI